MLDYKELDELITIITTETKVHYENATKDNIIDAVFTYQLTPDEQQYIIVELLKAFNLYPKMQSTCDELMADWEFDETYDETVQRVKKLQLNDDDEAELIKLIKIWYRYDDEYDFYCRVCKAECTFEAHCNQVTIHVNQNEPDLTEAISVFDNEMIEWLKAKYTNWFSFVD